LRHPQISKSFSPLLAFLSIFPREAYVVLDLYIYWTLVQQRGVRSREIE
jgi:hypothetical protein